MSDFQRRGPEETVNKSSERQFGLVMAGFFAILALLALWRGHGGFALGWSSAAAVFAGAALLVPALLKPLNALWFRFGLLLHKIMTPLIMGAMFFLVFTPIALISSVSKLYKNGRRGGGGAGGVASGEREELPGLE